MCYSHRNVQSSVVLIRKISEFHANGRTHTDAVTVTSVELGNGLVPSNQSNTESVTLTVPVSEPTVNGKICRVYYHLELEVNPSWALRQRATIPTVMTLPGQQPLVTRPSDFDVAPPQITNPTVTQFSQFAPVGPSHVVPAPFVVSPQPPQPPVQQVSENDAMFDQLIAVVGATNDKVNAATTFLARSGSNQLRPSPEQFANLISQEFSLTQHNLATAVAPSVVLTCAHAAAVMSVASFASRMDVLRAIAPYIIDKQNRQIILDNTGILERDEIARIFQ
eukprot:c6065_g1_i1.p1 GENE.c6065_g1_i1~~c6065_g1_i1.p1  ORF type:complete len:279 (+),score=68.10 c6065_g1_i1:666-1502(+)